jgi:ATP-dependent exoDNAse (exonuclease V) beta subunit
VRLPLSLHEPEAAPEYSWVGQTARAVGTIVHAELQRLAVDSATAPTTREPHPGDYDSWLAELGVPQRERAIAAARVVAALTGIRRDTRGQWLLASTHRDACSERRLSGVHEGQLLNIIIDRSFIDDAGHRWVIDYKTSTHEGGALDQFLQSEMQRYRPQLQRYAALAAGLGPEPVRAALYFPLLGEFREVPLD